nr:protein kinase-like domain, concanavalin A-like lectin/glucanase domain protein [Tanacetum cinerariifolium]
MTSKIDIVFKSTIDQIAGALLSDMVKSPKLNVNSTTSVLSVRSYPTTDPQCSTHIHGDDGDVIFIEIVKKNDDSRKEEPKAGGLEVEYFDIFPTRSELAYYKYLMTDEISYKLPHKIEQYNSLSDLEKEHTKSVYLRNEEDKKGGVEYVMSKILRFYKECLELGPEYLTGIDDDEEVT